MEDKADRMVHALGYNMVATTADLSTKDMSHATQKMKAARRAHHHLLSLLSAGASTRL